LLFSVLFAVPKYGYSIFFELTEIPIIMGNKDDKLLKEFGKNLQKLREARG
jgi:hypothetical protein